VCVCVLGCCSVGGDWCAAAHVCVQCRPAPSPFCLLFSSSPTPFLCVSGTCDWLVRPAFCRECSSNGRAVASHATGTGIDALHFQTRWQSIHHADPVHTIEREREKGRRKGGGWQARPRTHICARAPPRQRRSLHTHAHTHRTSVCDACAWERRRSVTPPACPEPGFHASSWFPPKFPPG
jgi:hypothetical protein